MDRRLGLALALVAAGSLRFDTAHADGPAAPAVAVDYEAQLAAKAPSIVTIKYLAAYEGSNEYPVTALGVVIDGSGLVLASNGNFGDGTVKIRDMKILVGNEPKEWGAILVARDTNLDLAYVQIMDPEGKTFVAVDLGRGRDPKIGENLFGVTRNGRGFDYAPAIKRIYVTSKIESPRLVFDFAGDFTESGLPAFDATGAPVGILANQQGAEGGDDDGGTHHDVFLLPLPAVTKSVAAAKKRIPDAVAKARESAKDTPPAPAPVSPPADAPKPPEPAAPVPSR